MQNAALLLQLHSPTGVTHSAPAFLTRPATPTSSSAASAPLPDLVVIRSTCLEVYAARRLTTDSKSDVKLELVAQQRLFGVVESLAVLRGRAGGSGHDALLLAFRDAKLSVLAWDAASGDLVPSSLHYFEGDESLKSGRQTFPRPPLVVSDPQGRCAAVVMLRHQMAVLPATQSEAAALGVFAEELLYGGAAAAGNGSDAAAAAPNSATAAVGNSYVDNLSKMNIREVRDAAFLHGSAEPMLCILHENEPTWAGSLRTRKDTCALSALSLNLSAKRHPRIWGVQGLPFDAYRVLPAPCGGALVLCTACILYYSQSHQAGVVLHSGALPAAQAPPPLMFDLSRGHPGEAAAKYAKEHAMKLPPLAASGVLSFCDTSNAGWNLECDAAHAAWVSPTSALLGLKTGQLLAVELQKVGGGEMRVRVARVGAAPPPSCIAALSPSVVFIGSIAGDSLLVGCSVGDAAAQAAEKARKKSKQEEVKPQVEGLVEEEDADEVGGGSRDKQAAKRRRLESTDADTAVEKEDGDASEDEDEEALLLYGPGDGDAAAEAAAASALSPALRPTLRVLDSFVGIGPVRCMASSASGATGGEPPYLLACCGRGKSGALAVVRRSVAADVVTEVPLPDVMGGWAVGGGRPGAEHHQFLLLSFPGATKVLATGVELKEVTDDVEFAGDTATIAAGTVYGGIRVVQAFREGVRLLENGEQKQDVWAADLAAEKSNAALRAVHISDPFILAHLVDGAAWLLRVNPSSGAMETLSTVPPPSPSGSRVTACCLYRDACGWMQRHLPGADASELATFCVACFSDGSCGIWVLPEFGAAPLWSCASLGQGPPLLTCLPSVNLLHVDSGAEIVEIRIESFADAAAHRSDLSSSHKPALPACSAPVLVALTKDNSLLVYKAYSSDGSAPDGAVSATTAAAVRFKRIAVDAPSVCPPPPLPAAWKGAALPRMARFDGLGEQIPHSGIYIAGTSPLWLIVSRGTIFTHPAHLALGVAAVGFTPFHNVNSPHAFITVCSGARSCIQISGLPPRQRLDAPWPRQKILIKATPLQACLYPEAQLFAVAAARSAPAKPFLPEDEPGEPQASYSYALAEAAAAARGTFQQHEVRLVRPGTWDTVWQHALTPGETVFAVEAVHLRDVTTGATVPLLAVGAGFSAGEDYPCSGRVLLFEVQRKEGEKGEWGAEMIYAREFKGPVTSLASMEGHLLLSTGHRLEICTLSSVTTAAVGGEGDADGGAAPVTTYKLVRSAFFDGPSLVTSLSVVKSFVLVGDAAHSVQFVRYKDENRQLALLGKDFGRAEVRAVQFLIAGSSLHMVAADGGGSLRTFAYALGDPGSWKGQRLVQWGAMHVGGGIGAMTRLRMPQLDPGDSTPRQAVLCGLDDGGFAAVLPLAAGEHMLQPKGPDGAPRGTLVDALKALQQELTAGAAHAAGLNPGAFRRRHVRAPEAAKPFGPPLPLAAQGLLDGDLLMRFVTLPRATQTRMAAKAGVTREAVLPVLAAFARTSYLL